LARHNRDVKEPVNGNGLAHFIINGKNGRLGKDSMPIFWWVRQFFLTFLGCFFLFFGINILIAAYKLNDPFNFVMTFFASNLMILISTTLIIGFVYRMIISYKNWKDSERKQE
jgi:hypothetical protein